MIDILCGRRDFGAEDLVGGLLEHVLGRRRNELRKKQFLRLGQTRQSPMQVPRFPILVRRRRWIQQMNEDGAERVVGDGLRPEHVVEQEDGGQALRRMMQQVLILQHQHDGHAHAEMIVLREVMMQ